MMVLTMGSHCNRNVVLKDKWCHSKMVFITGCHPELKRRKKQQPNFQRTDRGKNHVCAENLTADLSVRQAKGVDFSAKD